MPYFSLIACSFASVYFKNIFTDFSEKTLAKSEYLADTITFLANDKAIWTLLAGYIVIFDSKLKELMCITKVLIFSFNAVLANSFLSMSSTLWVVCRVSAVI